MIGAALDPQVRGQLRSVALAAAAILAVVATLAWFSVEDGSGTSLLVALASVVLLPLTALVGTGTMMIYAAEGRRIERDPAVPRRHAHLAALAPIAVGLTLFGLAPLASSASVWGRRHVMLASLEPGFYRMMAADTANRAVPTLRYGDRTIPMQVEPTSPRRYYFAMGGMADNSSGFVYDPTDAVLTARGWNADNRFTAPPRVREWFGGDIVGCSRVRGHFHYCGLT